MSVTDKPRVRHIRLSSHDRRAALVQAALACISESGMRGFTVDRICEKAQVSRGLIAHHFGTMDALLTAAYTHMYALSSPDPADLATDRPAILALLDSYFAPQVFNRQTLNIWLALWSQISTTAPLRAEHRAQYRRYHALTAAALAKAAPRPIDAASLATSLICLVDGLGLQHCIDPDAMPAATARKACLDLITPHVGPLE